MHRCFSALCLDVGTVHHTGVDGGCSSRRITHLTLPKYEIDDIDQGIVGEDGLPKKSQFAEVCFNSSKLQAAHTVTVIAPSGTGKTTSTYSVEDGARVTSAIYECLYQDSARLQGVLYARKEVEMCFTGQTLNFVRFPSWHRLSQLLHGLRSALFDRGEDATAGTYGLLSAENCRDSSCHGPTNCGVWVVGLR